MWDLRTHFWFLVSSIAAPRSAVDLARSHPEPKTLGWLYVVITSVVALLSDLLVRSIFVQTPETDPMSSFLDSVWVLAVVGTVSYALIYVIMQKFWRKFADENIGDDEVSGAIVATFALSCVLMVPQYLFIDWSTTGSTLIQVLGVIVPVAAAMYFSTLYFSHALKITYLRSALFNVLLGAIFFAIFTGFLILVFFGWLMFSDVNLDQLMQAPEANAQ